MFVVSLPTRCGFARVAFLAAGSDAATLVIKRRYRLSQLRVLVLITISSNRRFKSAFEFKLVSLRAGSCWSTIGHAKFW